MPTAVETVTYHIYAGPEAFARGGKLHTYLLTLGQLPPNPMLSVAFTAEDADGVIRACSVIHSLPIVEPFHADPGYGFTLGELFDQTQRFIMESGAPRVLMHTEHRAMQRMLDQVGAERWHVAMYQWLRESAARMPRGEDE